MNMFKRLLRYLRHLPEKEICVIIPSYNNAQWYKKNLDSVFNQRYNNYKVIYIDDCSSDQTAQLVQQYIETNKLQNKIIFIQNLENVGATANRYFGSHLAPDNAIVMILDGDDWFAHNNVMNYINRIYSTTDTWLTYGQFRRYPSNEKGQCKWLPQDYDFRQMDQWYTSALRTYYAWLFKQIPKEAFMQKGKFYQVAGDVAEMLPMLETARGHITFTPKVTYIYNQVTPFNDCKIKKQEQVKAFEYIKQQVYSNSFSNRL